MQPYSLFLPNCPANGIIFNSPHSGTYLPEEFLKKISIDPALLHFSGDLLVDKLIAETPRFGAAAFINNYARTYVDTNRSAREIDPEMFHNLPPTLELLKSSKMARGFGVFSRKSYNGLDIYPEKLPAGDINHRLDQVYHPVHNALNGLLQQQFQSHRYYVLIDCHSMPSYAFIDPGFSGAKQADVVIGDCFQSSCHERLGAHVAKYFSNHGLKVIFNVPYSGGYNTQHYGQPNNAKQAMQLEFNRALYMNEKTLEANDGFRPLKDILTGLSENLNKNISGLFFPEEKF